MAKILVIDDEDLVCEMLEMTISDMGHDVMTVSDGAEGIKKLGQEQFDLIITDLIMPEKDGLEFIKDMNLMSNEIPIIVMSGGSRIGNVDFLEVASQMGAKYTFFKPVDHEDLEQAIIDCLSQ